MVTLLIIFQWFISFSFSALSSPSSISGGELSRVYLGTEGVIDYQERCCCCGEVIPRL
jgi:hypothetical protein